MSRQYIIREQEQSRKQWHGIQLSELSSLAQDIYHGAYVDTDLYNFLLFCYPSNSRKTIHKSQCSVENGILSIASSEYYPVQTWDPTVDFVNKVNEIYSFK